MPVTRGFLGRRRDVDPDRMPPGQYLTPDFPPAFISVGNADPLEKHSKRLTAALTTHDVKVDTLFFPDGYQPPLLHEYQFRLDGPDAQRALARLVAFLEGHA